LELLEGRIYEMTLPGSRHAACVDRLTRVFFDRLGAEVIVRVQGPVHIDRYTQLCPDVALLQPRDDFYASAHPRPGDILLLVEVADTTLLRDRKIKMPVYGRAGVPESWLVDVNARRVEVYSDPSDKVGYRATRATNCGEIFSPGSFKSLAIDPLQILG
jgi:Uma2 family endonuclease